MSDQTKPASPPASPTEAARRYREEAGKFADSGKAEGAAKRAAPKDAKERADMDAAEQEGLRHSKANGK